MEKTSVRGGDWFKLKLKLPSMSVIVPMTCPFTRILTPIRGTPVSASFTVPEIVVSCANDFKGGIKIRERKKMPIAQKVLLKFSIRSLGLINVLIYPLFA